MKPTFSRLCKLECKKAMGNKFFLVALGLSLLFCLLSAGPRIEAALAPIDPDPAIAAKMAIDARPTVDGLYMKWIGGEASSLGFSLMVVLLPMLAMLPYGWSFAQERRSGYTKMMVLKTGKTAYFLSKYIATFVAAAVVVALPMLLNFVAIACFFTAHVPNIQDGGFGVEYGELWSKLMFTVPVVYVLLYLILNFLFAGLFGTMSLVASFFSKNRLVVLLAPFFFMLIFHYAGAMASTATGQLSPLYFLHSTALVWGHNGWIVLAEGVLFFALTFGITMGLGRKRELL